MIHSTLHETILRSRTNIIHLNATFDNNSTDKIILNAVLEDLNLLITFLKRNQTSIDTAKTKFQINFIEEFVREKFALELIYWTRTRKKPSLRNKYYQFKMR